MYLDIHYGGRRKWKAIGLTLGADARTNRETMRVAEIIRQKRELQIVSGEWGLIDPLEGKRTLVSYAEELVAKQDPKNHLPKSLKYLPAYAKEIHISAVTERFLDGYQEYLAETELSKATMSH